MNVAVVGVGNMGAPMAGCIARAGHTVTVFDSSREQALKVAAAHGGRAAASLDDLAGSQFVVTMLPTGQVVSDCTCATVWPRSWAPAPSPST